jgi:transposase
VPTSHPGTNQTPEEAAFWLVSSHDVSAALGIDEKTVRNWLKRFREDGLEGLDDAPRSS